MRDALRPGGLWLFAGPLEYHTWPGLCPTLSQLVELAAEEGSHTSTSNPHPHPRPNPDRSPWPLALALALILILIQPAADSSRWPSRR